MTVDSRLDDLETFQRQYENLHVPGKLNKLADEDTLTKARLDQMQAQMTALTAANAANSQAIVQLQTAQTQLLAGCLALQAAMNAFRVDVHCAFRGIGGTV